MTVSTGSRPVAKPRILVTGATGLVGRALLCEILQNSAATVTALVRAEDEAHAARRCGEMLAELFGPDGARALAARVTAMPGDLEKPLLGLDRPRWQWLAENVTHICHSAASVRFDLPLADARRVNVEGTRSVLELARAAQSQGRLERFGYVSTAFVAGRHRRTFGEDELDVGQRFRNTYERSKFEAEQILRSAMADVPITVVRPSIVMGHSVTGETTAFNVLYVPVRLYASGRYRHLPTSSTLPIDVVPVDFVARLIHEAVVRGGRPGFTYAAAAGHGATTAGEVASMASSVFDREPPVFVRPRLAPWVLTALARLPSGRARSRKRAALLPYLPYMLRGSRFDTSNADELLRPLGLRAPTTSATLGQILEFARDTNFGKNRAEFAHRMARSSEERRHGLRLDPVAMGSA